MRYRVGISRSGLRFVCESGMTLSWIWCVNDLQCQHEVEWKMEQDWLVVVEVVVELQQEEVVL